MSETASSAPAPEGDTARLGEALIREGALGPGSASDAVSAPAPPPCPSDFGRYRLERLLGQGGMGIVWLARDRELDRPVALKQIRTQRAEEPGLLERFLREVRLAARLKHPGIVPVFDVGVCDGRPYFTSDWVDGPSLADLLAGRAAPAEPITPRRGAEWVRAAAEALEGGGL